MKRKKIPKKIQQHIEKAAEKFIHESWDKAYPFFTEDKINETRNNF
ncbi:hypothetical protein LCGC14_0615130 [marine sediment metagenome]|uniref:Uncharacterized protein n=1 Tax=marine sediment metagenome TaxID=412755 RepID=A0A0F9UEW5_9ZZZZ